MRSVSCAVGRLPSVAGFSHGALAVSVSRSLASACGGLQVSGGATTTERAESGASAAIIAVSARKRCSTANSVLPDSAPELVSPAASTPVSVSSASRTFIDVPAGVVIEVTASSGW